MITLVGKPRKTQASQAQKGYLFHPLLFRDGMVGKPRETHLPRFGARTPKRRICAQASGGSQALLQGWRANSSSFRAGTFGARNAETRKNLRAGLVTHRGGMVGKPRQIQKGTCLCFPGLSGYLFGTGWLGWPLNPCLQKMANLRNTEPVTNRIYWRRNKPI